MKLLKLAYFLMPFTNLLLFNNFNISDLLFLLVIITSFNRKLTVNYKTIVVLIFNFTFIICLITSLVFVDNYSESFYSIIQYIFILLIIPIATLLNISTKQELIKIINSFYLGLVSVVFYHLFICVFKILEYTTIHGRFYGIYENPWILSYIMCISLAMTLIYITFISSIKFRLMNLIILFLEIYIIILSGARTSFLVMLSISLITILLYAYDKLSKNIFPFFLLVMFIICMLLVANFKKLIIFSSPIMMKISPIFYVKLQSFLSDDTDSYRMEMYENGFKMILDNIFIIIGLGNYSREYGMSMHNIFLSLFIEAGVLSVLIIFVVIVIFLVSTIKNISLLESKIILLMLVVFLIFGMFNPVLTLRVFWIPIVFGILHIYMKWRNIE